MRSKFFLLLVPVLSGSFTFAALSNETPTIIDFEALSRGEIVSEQFYANGMHVSAHNWSSGPDSAVVFDTTNIGSSEDNDLLAPFDPAPGMEAHGDLSPGNVLILHERNDCTSGMCAEPDDESTRPAGWIEFEFAVPVTLHGMKLIDINYEADESPAQMVLLDIDGNIIDTLDIPGVAGQGNWLPWSIERSGVSRARLHLPGDGAIDDLAFTPDQQGGWPPVFVSSPPVAVSPEATYRYTPVVEDRDGESVTLQLLTGPPGMALGPDGELSWTPSGMTGSFAVEIQATDATGSTSAQAFTLHSEAKYLHIEEFELPAGTIADDEFLAHGLSVSAYNASEGENLAVIFDTAAPTGGDTDLSAPFSEGSLNDLGLGELTPGHVLVLHERHDCDVQGLTCAEPDDESSNPAGWIDFRFSQPAHVWSLDVFDVTSDDPAARAVELFDANGQPLGSGLTLTRTGGNDWDRLVVDTTGVTRMRVNLDGDAALDNLRYALVGSAEPENRPPVINDEEFEMLKNEVLSIPAPGVLANDSDPDGDAITAVLDEAPAFGSVVLNPDGSFVYTPDTDFVGKDEFEYRVRDAESASIAEDVEVYVMGEPTSDPDPGTDPEPEPEPGPEPVPAPTIESFTLSPYRILEGESSTLSWSVTNAAQVTINGNPVASSGSLVVSPTVSTTYALHAVSPEGGTTSWSRTLVVKDFVPLTFYSPQEGAWVSGPRPTFGIHYDSVYGIYPPDLHFEYQGERLFVTCMLLSGQRMSCRPDAAVAEGAMTLTAYLKDDTRIYSNIAVLNFNVDSTPPYAPDASKITVSKPDAENRVTLTGLPGAVEPLSLAKIRTNIYQGFNNIPTNPDGSFSYTFTSSGGATFTLASRDAVGHMSAYTDFQVPYPDPALSIASPQAGAFVNNSQPEILLGYPQVGAGLDFNTLAVTDNGVQLLVNCTHQSAESRCIPSTLLAEGAHSVTATISDTAGNTSNVASSNFSIDTTPPDPVDRSKVSLVQEPEGTVTIAGEEGAAEAGATVIATIGTTVSPTTAGTAGAFAVTGSGYTGDLVQVSQRDPAGNASQEEVFTIQQPPVHLAITSHGSGAYVAGDHVTIEGTHDGDIRAGISVNGVRALIMPDGRFIAAGVPLQAGSNTITASASTFDGQISSVSIEIESGAVPSPIDMRISVIEGPAPLRVKFEVEYHGDPADFHHLEIDADGDGTAESVSAEPRLEYEHTYSTATLYRPRVALAAYSGWSFEEKYVRVRSFQEMDQMFRDLWAGWRSSLEADDVEDALVYIMPSQREKHRGTFEALAGRWQQIFQSFTGFEAGFVSSGFTEYAVNRLIDGQDRLFLVYFAQDEYGVWRLYSF